MAGHTPLFYCTGLTVTELTLKMADILIKNGADVNATDRLGGTPLFHPTIDLNFGSIDFLMVSLGCTLFQLV